VRRPSRKVLTIAALALTLVAVGGLGHRYALRKAWTRYNQYDRRLEGGLRVGDAAPDLDLVMYDGSPARLSSLWGDGKPLFLVFGSCT
jgi:hypothetical protein